MSTEGRVSRRDQQAAETRRLILDAARRLFAANGYAATSVAQIADEAGVAVPTVYASVGNKMRLLTLLNDRIDEEGEVAPIIERLLASQDPSEVLGLQLLLARQLNERAGDLIAALRSAATAEPGMAAPYAVGLERHRSGVRATATRLSQLGGLREGLTTEAAAALLDVLLAPDSWTTLTTAHGMGWEEAQELLEDLLTRVLLVPEP